MGARFRKSVNLGPVRINISKSGVGYSVGVPGYRVTKTARGTTRTTASIPGTGLSYVKETGRSASMASTAAAGTGEVEVIQDSPRIIEMESKIRRAKTTQTLGIVIACFGVLGVAWIWLGLLALVGGGIVLFARAALPLKLEYSFDAESKEEQEAQDAAWDEIRAAGRIYLNIGGAKKFQVFPTGAAPWYVKCNVAPVTLGLGNVTLCIYPDVFMVINGKEFSICDFSDVQWMFTKDTVWEHEDVPEDAVVISERWEHQRKDGMPDMRYNDNPIIKVCQYWVLVAMGPDTEYFRLMISNKDAWEHAKLTFGAVKL